MKAFHVHPSLIAIIYFCMVGVIRRQRVDQGKTNAFAMYAKRLKIFSISTGGRVGAIPLQIVVELFCKIFFKLILEDIEDKKI